MTLAQISTEIGSSPVLSQRQQAIGTLAANGYPNRDIAAELKLTEQIVKNVIHSLFDKLGVWNRVELANYFLKSETAAARSEALKRIEEQRLAEVAHMKILDTAAERVFDEVAAIAAAVFDTPIALVALADSNRIWFKSSVGLEVAEAQREITICHHTIQQSGVFVVKDAFKDPRFSCNPLVKALNVRFYAAAPILTGDGYALGVVCVVDRVPRETTKTQITILESLARLALQQMELRRKLLEASDSNKTALAPTG